MIALLVAWNLWDTWSLRRDVAALMRASALQGERDAKAAHAAGELATQLQSALPRLFHYCLLPAACCLLFSGCQSARAQSPWRPFNCATPQGAYQRANAANQQPRLQRGQPEASIDHSQFATKSDLAALRGELADAASATQNSLDQHSTVINQVREHSISIGTQLDDLQGQTNKHLGSLAADLADARKAIEEHGQATIERVGELNSAVGAKLKQIDAAVPSEVKQQVKHAAAAAASEAVNQAAGPAGLQIWQLAIAFGGPPAGIALVIGWLVLRRMNKLAPLQALVNQLPQRSAGLGGAAPPAAFQGRPQPTAATDGNAGA